MLDGNDSLSQSVSPSISFPFTTCRREAVCLFVAAPTLANKVSDISSILSNEYFLCMHDFLSPLNAMQKGSTASYFI